MTKIKVILKTIKLNEPMMLFWSLIPLVVLIVTTNYLFNSRPAVLGVSTETDEIVSNDNSLGEVARKNNTDYKLKRTGVVTLVFAGATKNQFEYGYSYLDEKDILAVVSAPTAEIDKIESKMSWLNLRLLQHQGWEIASQSRDQICDKEKLIDQNILESEIAGSKKDFTEHGLYVNAYLAPCGLNSKEILNNVKKSYNSFVGFGVLYNAPNSSDKYNLIGRNINNDIETSVIKKWISDSNSYNRWLILVIPDINDSNDKFSITKEKFVEVVDIILNSDNQVATLGEVIKY